MIVGIDSILGESEQEFAQRMGANYRCPELDRLLLSPLFFHTNPGEEGGPTVEVSIQSHRPGQPMNASNIQNSMTAIFSTQGPAGGTVVLAHSTRYMRDDFVSFASNYGWSFLTSVNAPDESSFVQLLFRKK